MTSTQLKRILNGANISTNSGISVIEQNCIRTLIFPSNQGIDTRSDVIYIDDNNIMKIKKYKEILGAGKIGKFEYGDETKTWIKATDSSFILKHKSLSYNPPKAGDILFTVNKKTGKTVKTYSIKSASRKYIECDSEIKINTEEVYVCYSSSEDYQKIIQNPFDFSEFLKFIPYTNNKYDIYLDVNQLVGIEFVSEKVGNS